MLLIVVLHLYYYYYYYDHQYCYYKPGNKWLESTKCRQLKFPSCIQQGAAQSIGNRLLQYFCSNNHSSLEKCQPVSVLW